MECLFGFVSYFLSFSDAISASVQQQTLLISLGERHRNVIVWVEVYMSMIFSLLGGFKTKLQSCSPAGANILFEIIALIILYNAFLDFLYFSNKLFPISLFIQLFYFSEW